MTPAPVSTVTVYPCYWDGWHRRHVWNVIGDDWLCPGCYGWQPLLTSLAQWRYRLRRVLSPPSGGKP